jgi:hypothetical protein
MEDSIQMDIKELPYSAEVKNACSCTSTYPYVFMAWCLFTHKDNFTSEKSGVNCSV